MDPALLLGQRLFAQSLTAPHPPPQAADVVRRLVAVQSQDIPAAAWAIAQRCAEPRPGSLADALATGAVIRTHVLRPTWHYVSRDDLRPLLRLTGPRVAQAAAPYFRQFGLDAAEFGRIESVLRSELSGRAVSRGEIVRLLAAAGVDLTDSVRTAHVLLGAEISGVLCGGPPNADRHTYALVDDRVPPQSGEALPTAADLAGRYIRGHGPATAADFAWWSGLTSQSAKSALTAACSPAFAGAELITAELGGRTYFVDPRSPAADPAGVFLLPNYDEYMIAFARRDELYPAGWAPPAVARDNPVFRHLVLSDGRMVGTWRRTLAAASVVVEVTMLAAIRRSTRVALEEAADRYAAFLGRSLQLRFVGEH